MKHANPILNCLLSVGLLALVISCSTVPMTDRYQLNLIPQSEMMAMSSQQYQQFLGAHPRSSDPQGNALLQRVGQRIAAATEIYLEERGLGDRAEGLDWEFNLIEDPTVNAWAMPGGKIVVYTGMLPVMGGEGGLAVVLGHEIAHVIARHGNERMSQQLIAQMGGTALSVALKEEPDKTQQLWQTVYGVAAQYGAILPYSRVHEFEADRIGMSLIAMAGYDPEECIRFWERMSAQKSGASVPAFMSTHPSDVSRIQKMRENLPEARGNFRQQ